MTSSLRISCFTLLMVFSVPGVAQDRETPYWASLRVTKANMRVGPAGTYRILWVYRRDGLPLKVLRLKEGWRLVEDPDGVQGWMVGRFLSLDRTAIVIGKGLAAMRAESSDRSPLRFKLEPGVVGKLGDCGSGWCHLNVDGHEGYVSQARLWGAGNP